MDIRSLAETEILQLEGAMNLDGDAMSTNIPSWRDHIARGHRQRPACVAIEVGQVIPELLAERHQVVQA